MKINHFTYLLILACLCACSPQSNNNSIYVKPVCISSQSECIKNTPWGEVSIRFNVDEIVSETSFKVVLEVGNAKQNLHITGYLEGKDMYMGKIPLFFESRQQMYSSNVLIGSCAEPKMIWRMWLTITEEKQDKIHQAKAVETQFFIDFTSSRN